MKNSLPELLAPFEIQPQPTQADAIDLCRDLYNVLEPHGYYPALTGGQLYKNGSRKDIDVVIYRNRQKIKSFDMRDIESLLANAGVKDALYFGFVTKCTWNGWSVDLFNPESNSLTESEYSELHQLSNIE